MQIIFLFFLDQIFFQLFHYFDNENYPLTDMLQIQHSEV